ncbi:MAG TPA: hypothetical protein VM582_03390 [Candidatus Thermoplasmatota archaeon]|nr:hypothetical protein [Candidatus Thermoplasmatota archaeon]
MNPRLLRLLVGATLLSVALAGCADNDESTGSPGDAPDPTEGIEQGGGEVLDNETSEDDPTNETTVNASSSS